mmetsp:Transcript_13432/g.36862  ORF Transcript_13432/g.36862 Transcript_13432/m.36862 type:complete len:190 (-) Transcript_13432:85-654(-)
MHNFPNERVLVFAEDAEAQIQILRSSDALGRLDEPDDSPSLVRVVPSATPWASLAPFDVVLQAAPLPGRGENYRRLASCRKFAVALTAVDADQVAKEVKVMPGWEPKSMTATRKRLKTLSAQLKAGWQEDFLEQTFPEEVDKAVKFGPQDTDADVDADFKMDRRGDKTELVWAAGIEEDDMELVFDKGI